jgi:uncharacterized protein YbjT (DUF2867 family)
MKISVTLTGATGMVGEGVLIECLAHPEVEKILVIGRNLCGMVHPKLKEIIHKDFKDITPIINQLTDYNTCFFCSGVTSIGKSESEYYDLTYTLTLNFAKALSRLNPEMTFCYISGAATDSSEKGRSMWARVKGKTENDLIKLPFKRVYNFRPGFMRPTKGMKNTLSYYKYVGWMYPVLRFLFPKFVTTLKELGIAMINSAANCYEKNILEVKDILILSK